MAWPGTIICMFEGRLFVRGVFIRTVIPFVLGFSWSCVWMKDILGLYFLFRVSIRLSSEWDSTMHMMVMLFLDARLEIIFHLFIVDGLLEPFIFSEAILMCPMSLWDGVGGSGAVTCTRPFAKPAHQSLQPWVMAGSRPSHGRWGERPVAIVTTPCFIGVIVLMLLTVGSVHLSLQPF